MLKDPVERASDPQPRGKPQEFHIVLQLVQARQNGIDAVVFRFGRLDRMVR